MTNETEIDRILEDLRPSKRYIIRVRAINEFGQPSNWSDALEYITPGDNSIPAGPTDLLLDFESPDMIARWTKPDFNTDGSIISDLSHYRVTLQSPGGQTAVFETAATRFTLSYDLNVATFGTPQPILLISVRAVDNTDQLSAALTGTATNPVPPTPASAPQLVPAFTLINISMDKNNIFDFDHFLLEHSTNGTNFIPLSLPIGDTNYSHEVAPGSTHFYRYKIVDKFNQVSPNFSPVSQATTYNRDVLADEDPPSIPTNFRITELGFTESTSAYVEFAWNASADDSAIAYYEIRYKPQDRTVFSSLVVGGTEDTTARVENLAPDTLHHAKIRSVDTYGNASAYTSLLPFQTDTDDAPPAVPLNLRTKSGIETIGVSWDPNTESDFSKYELYGVANNAAFTPGVANLLYSGNGTAFVLQEADPADTWHFRVRALDRYENASAYTVAVSGTSTPAYSPDTVPPATPTNVLVATSLTTTEQISRAQITVNWDANTEEDLGGYELGIKQTAETIWTTFSIPKGNNSYVVKDLLAGTQYDIRLAAFDVQLNKSAYHTADITTLVDTVAPPAVQNLVVTPFIKSTRLAWDAVIAGDLSHYNVHVGESAVFTPTAANKYTQTSSTSVTVNKYWDGAAWVDMVTGGTYHFKVTAEDRSGNVSVTSDSSGSPDDIGGPGQPDAPTNLVIAEVSDLLSVSFTGVVGDVTGYEVWALYDNTDDYVLIAELTPSDLDTNIGEVLDQNVVEQGTVYYKVYALNQAIRSVPLTGSHTVTRAVSEVGLDFNVEPMATSFILTWDIPEDRLLEYISIAYEARPTDDGLFDLVNAVQVYQGVSDSYIHEIESAELDYYHQFWLTVQTRV